MSFLLIRFSSLLFVSMFVICYAGIHWWTFLLVGADCVASSADLFCDGLEWIAGLAVFVDSFYLDQHTNVQFYYVVFRMCCLSDVELFVEILTALSQPQLHIWSF